MRRDAIQPSRKYPIKKSTGELRRSDKKLSPPGFRQFRVCRRCGPEVLKIDGEMPVPVPPLPPLAQSHSRALPAIGGRGVIIDLQSLGKDTRVPSHMQRRLLALRPSFSLSPVLHPPNYPSLPLRALPYSAVAYSVSLIV